MLKKIMKAALAASLVFGMSSFAYAADFSVGGKFRQYFGQYNSGVEDESAHFMTKEEANVKFNGKAGKLSLYHEMESATDADYANTQTVLGYVLPFGKLDIGNVTNIATIPVSSSGWTTSNIPYATRRGLVWAGYSENEGAQLTIPLEGMGFIQFTMYAKADHAGLGGLIGDYNDLVAEGVEEAMDDALAGLGVTGDDAWAYKQQNLDDAIDDASAYDGGEGTSMQLGADLNFGGIGVRFGYTTAATDDPSNPDDESISATSMLLGARVPLGEAMSIGFDYVTFKGTCSDWSDDAQVTTTDFDFQMSGIGPGKIIVSYDMVDAKWGDPLYKRAVTSFVFDAPVAKGAGVQAGYIANAYTPEGEDTVTETYMAGGLYASF